MTKISFALKKSKKANLSSRYFEIKKNYSSLTNSLLTESSYDFKIANPCPASITVMLLALSIGQFGSGLLAVAGFSLGLAIALVGIGLIVVAGISRLQNSGRFHWISAKAPIISASVVILSGVAALVFAH